jgi:hypothetical protein
VERRRETRLKVRQPVTLTVLGDRGKITEACVLDVSSGGVQLRAPAPVPCGAPIKIDGDNTSMLGEVCRCVPAEGAYNVGVQLIDPSPTLLELEHLNRSLIGERREAKHEVASSRRAEKNLDS